MEQTTTGTLLGGRVSYRQLRRGHRTGFEPVLLAASVAARPGELVLEAGTGAGAALLCLAARLPGLTGIGAERDEALGRLAKENFKNNGFSDLSTVLCDVAALPFAARTFDHAIANPPWFAARNTASPDALRDLAHRAVPHLLAGWVGALACVLRPRGSLTLILPAGELAVALAALRAAGCGGSKLFPLWPRPGQAAKIIILSARKGAKNPDQLLPGLVLHDAGGITEAAQRILRDAQATSGVLNTA